MASRTAGDIDVDAWAIGLAIAVPSAFMLSGLLFWLKQRRRKKRLNQKRGQMLRRRRRRRITVWPGVQIAIPQRTFQRERRPLSPARDGNTPGFLQM